MRTLPLLMIAAVLPLSGCDYIKSFFSPKPDIYYAAFGEG